MQNLEEMMVEMGVKLSKKEMEAFHKVAAASSSPSEFSFSDEEETFSDDSCDGSVKSLPEFQDLEEVVFGRYKKYHPKDLIPSEEKLVALFLREFNDAFCDLENEYEDDQEDSEIMMEEYQRQLKTLKKKKKNVKVKNIKTKMEILRVDKKEKKQEFLKKKDELEKYYCLVCVNAIKRHPEPPGELSSILNLLEKNASTLHAICLHLNHFAYIDSELDDDSDDELASMDGDELSDDELPTLPNILQDSDGNMNQSDSSADSDFEIRDEAMEGSSSKAN
jgi:hypothetical protein